MRGEFVMKRVMSLASAILALGAIALAQPAYAEFRNVDMRVFGMD
jgi:hypothetical protein